MNNLDKEKTDVVSVILDNTDLLDVFADTLTIEEDMKEEFSLSETSLGWALKMKCYLWKKAKEIMNILSNKIQVLAVLTEYNFKNEVKKIQMPLKKD